LSQLLERRAMLAHGRLDLRERLLEGHSTNSDWQPGGCSPALGRSRFPATQRSGSAASSIVTAAATAEHRRRECVASALCTIDK
jgi:hypothetical protein